MSSIVKKNYHNHIQTLRAVAVLLVFAFHLKIDFFSNGYLGVDIFFLISGYVITKHLLDNFDFEKNPIKNFFIKRIFRIVPVYFFIIGLFYFIFLLFGPLTEIDYFIDKLKYIISFTTNIFYLNYQRDYFDNIFDDPLNHTWSLGVEMQFYLLYPFFLYYLIKNKINLKRVFITIILLLFLFTLIVNFKNKNLVFYFPLFRFWEFLLGGLAYLYNVKKKFSNNSLFVIFFFLILCLKIFFFKGDDKIIDLLIVVLSTFYFLYYYTNENILKKLFNNKILIYLGNISYSFYLWHLLIIYFYDLYFDYKYKYLICLIVTIAFSHITYHLVEIKFKKLKPQINLLYIITIFFLTVFTLLAIKNSYYDIKNFIIKNNYLEKNFQLSKRLNYKEIKINDDKSVYDFCTEKSKNFTINQYSLKNECLKIKNNKILTYIEGNSHTAIMVPLILNSNEFENIYYENTTKISYEKVNQQKYFFDKIIYVRTINSIDEIIFFENNINNFDSSINFLIISTIPNFSEKIDTRKCLIKKKPCFYETNDDFINRNLDEYYLQITNLKKSFLNKNIYIYHPYKKICANKKCPIYYIQENLFTHRDNNHLTIQGVMLLLNDFKNFIKSHPQIITVNN
jgi:peptidoglycan/LPS O-acetylase OafA/YrhL